MIILKTKDGNFVSTGSAWKSHGVVYSLSSILKESFFVSVIITQGVKTLRQINLRFKSSAKTDDKIAVVTKVIRRLKNDYSSTQQ